MKKHIAISKLVLRRETVRALDHMQLGGIRGGADTGAGTGCPGLIDTGAGTGCPGQGVLTKPQTGG